MDLTALGNRIRSLRIKCGFTQEELGEKAGLNYKYIGEIERASKTASIESLGKIAKGLNVPLIEIVRFDHESGDKKHLQKQIRDLLNEMSNEELRLTLKIIKAIRY